MNKLTSSYLAFFLRFSWKMSAYFVVEESSSFVGYNETIFFSVRHALREWLLLGLKQKVFFVIKRFGVTSTEHFFFFFFWGTLFLRKLNIFAPWFENTTKGGSGVNRKCVWKIYYNWRTFNRCCKVFHFYIFIS